MVFTDLFLKGNVFFFNGTNKKPLNFLYLLSASFTRQLNGLVTKMKKYHSIRPEGLKSEDCARTIVFTEILLLRAIELKGSLPRAIW